MQGPLCRVSAYEGEIYKRVDGLFNVAGFEKYANKLDEYLCDSFSLNIEDMNLQNLDDFRYSPNFDGIIKKDNIISMDIGGYGSFLGGFDKKNFEQFRNIKSLTTSNFEFGGDISSFFPQIEAWRSLDWKSNSIKSLGSAWKNLRYLGIQGFSGSLKIFDGRDLWRLFLIASRVRDFSEFTIFSNLRTLVIDSYRGEGDVSILSELKALEALNISGGKKISGWENFYSQSLKYLDVEYCPLENVRKHFPNLVDFSLNARPRDPLYSVGGDIGRLSGQFTSLTAEWAAPLS